MAKKTTDVYTNEDGEHITKVEDVNGVVLVESFLNSEENLEYTTYIQNDGGIIDIDTNKLDDEGIKSKYQQMLKELIENDLGDIDE